MTTVVRPVNYTGTMQRLVVTDQIISPITVNLWGGGGGGGGSDAGSSIGGYGSGSGWAQVVFEVVPGDIIDVAVGGAGGPGAGFAGSAPGGYAGASWQGTSPNFSTRTAVGTWGSVAAAVSYEGLWLPWMNANAVLAPFGNSTPFSYLVNFPVTGIYNFLCGADVNMTVDLDGSTVVNLTFPTYPYYAGSYVAPSPVIVPVSVTAGVHLITINPINDGGTVGFALAIATGQTGYSGGIGGNSGPIPYSGAGGGGGGASVVFLNNTAIAVAAGGGGGGGGGRFGAGGFAPGPNGIMLPPINNGQSGQNHPGDGGGGGAGGGGYGGGNGGLVSPGDAGAEAGAPGGNLGDETGNPSGRNPYLPSNFGNPGRGGTTSTAGTNGQAVFYFKMYGQYVKSAGQWQPVITYIKNNSQWSEVQGIYVKENNQWKQIIGNDETAPVFVSTGTANFGTNPRSAPEVGPPPETPSSF